MEEPKNDTKAKHGFLNSIKKINEKHQAAKKKKQDEQRANAARLAEMRGALLGTLMVEYVGGHSIKPNTSGVLSLYEKQIHFQGQAAGASSFVIQASQIGNIAIEGKDEISRRVTAARLLLVGVFAFAFKKQGKDKEAFIIVEMTDGQEVVFHAKDTSPIELRAKYSSTITHFRKNSPKAVVASSVADELAKLVKLKDSGAVTQEEFDKEKTRLLS